MPKPIIEIDADTQTVTFGHPGVIVYTIHLDPWPTSQAEIEEKAREQVPDIPSDPSQLWFQNAVSSTEL